MWSDAQSQLGSNTQLLAPVTLRAIGVVAYLLLLGYPEADRRHACTVASF